MASEHMPTGGGSSSNDALFVPQLPPDIAITRAVTADQLIADMSKMPLFMQNLDDDDGSNIELEAIRALAYEGEPHEVAQNFRQQGNESYRTYQWIDAVEFYTKALAVKCGVKDIDEACYANRAACNLELRTYSLLKTLAITCLSITYFLSSILALLHILKVVCNGININIFLGKK